MNSREIQLIYIDDFFKSLREYGFRYSQKENTDVSLNLRIKNMNGVFILEIIHKVMNGLGISNGLPPSNKFMNFEKLDMKSFRIINRILIFMKKRKLQNFSEVFKDKIKEIEVIDKDDKANSIEYVSADDLNEALVENKIVRDYELHENLQFFLCLSSDKAFDKIMIKKLNKMIEMCKDNEYVLSIGPNKRPDPKSDVEDDKAVPIPRKKKRKLSDEDEEDFEEFDLTSEDEVVERKEVRFYLHLGFIEI